MLKALQAYSKSTTPKAERGPAIFRRLDSDDSPAEVEDGVPGDGVIVLGVAALDKKARCAAMTAMLQVRRLLSDIPCPND